MMNSLELVQKFLLLFELCLSGFVLLTPLQVGLVVLGTLHHLHGWNVIQANRNMNDC